MQLEVLTGANQGEVHEFADEVIIGRGEECTIRLADPSVSTRHAKIVVKPKPQVFDLGSANGIMINGEKKSTCPLMQNDVLNIGGVTMRVSLEEKKQEGKIKNPRRVMVLSLAVVLLFGIIGGSYYLKKNFERQTGELVALKFNDKKNLSLPAVNVRMPERDEFSVPISTFSSYTPKFLASKDRKGYASTADLALVEVLPPDPISTGFDYKNRSWTSYPPRLGSGRFLPEVGAVLGVYYGRGFNLRTEEWFNTTPPEFVSTNGEVTPLRTEFFIEVWDGLPPAAEIQHFSLDRKSTASLYEKVGLIPKQLKVPVAREQFIEPRTDWEQNAQGFIEKSGSNYQYYRVRQVKKGGALVILTAKCYTWQQQRVDELMEEMLKEQVIVGRDYDKADERVARAIELEREGDQIMPNVLEIGDIEDWNLISNRWDLMRAFNRYHQALVYLQQADRWPHDTDYKRIYAKAEAIYNYVQDPRGYFRKTYNDIETNITLLAGMRARGRDAELNRKRQLESLNAKVQELADVTRRGQDPAQFPILDEWFVYAHQRRLYVNTKFNK